MDLIMTIVLVVLLSFSRMGKDRHNVEVEMSVTDVQHLEICTNILMEREIEPFERIVKELGLKC